jgi:hypothetical protein
MYVSRRHLQQNGSMRVEEDLATYLTSRHFDRKEVEGERSISFFFPCDAIKEVVSLYVFFDCFWSLSSYLSFLLFHSIFIV